jgi:hypothetical protein
MVLQTCELTSDEVERRLRLVGPDAIEMQRPIIRSSLLNEFAKSIYSSTNQLFMLWSWIPLFYYHIHGYCSL